MTAPFRYYVRVRYQDCDAQHVVFNSRYSDYADLACFEFLRAALPRPTDGCDGSSAPRRIQPSSCPGIGWRFAHHNRAARPDQRTRETPRS